VRLRLPEEEPLPKPKVAIEEPRTEPKNWGKKGLRDECPQIRV
jgi:hypothetical protein